VRRFLFLFLTCALSFTVRAADTGVDPLKGRSRLYSKTDPSDTGGIHGRILRPAKAIEQILASPPDEPRLVYKGTIEGADQQSFRFTNLPMRKYDLIVIYNNSFFEGIQLLRGDTTLTAEDKKKINTTIQKSEPFYNHKILHRLEGETGRGNYARALYTFYLDRASELMYNSFEGGFSRDDPRRAIKLVILKDVGAGWQIVRTRDLYSKWATMGTLNPKPHFRKELSRIRVADSIKELGDINLNP